MEPLNYKERDQKIIKFTLLMAGLVLVLLALFFSSFKFPSSASKQQIERAIEVTEFKKDIYFYTSLIASLTSKSDSIAFSKDELMRRKIEASFESELFALNQKRMQADLDPAIKEFTESLNKLFNSLKLISTNSSKLSAGLDGTISKVEHDKAILNKDSKIEELKDDIRTLKGKLADRE